MLARGSKSRLIPSAPRSRTAAAACFAKLSRAAEVPRSAFWTFACELVHAKTLRVSTTRVPRECALLMTEVMDELVQPPQPVVVVPSRFFLRRLPLESAPTEKYAIVDSTS